MEIFLREIKVHGGVSVSFDFCDYDAGRPHIFKARGVLPEALSGVGDFVDCVVDFRAIQGLPHTRKSAEKLVGHVVVVGMGQVGDHRFASSRVVLEKRSRKKLVQCDSANAYDFTLNTLSTSFYIQCITKFFALSKCRKSREKSSDDKKVETHGFHFKL